MPPVRIAVQLDQQHADYDTLRDAALRAEDAGVDVVFFGSAEVATLSGKLAEFVSAVHAYEVTEALTYVKDGKVLPHYLTSPRHVESVDADVARWRRLQWANRTSVRARPTGVERADPINRIPIEGADVGLMAEGP